MKKLKKSELHSTPKKPAVKMLQVPIDEKLFKEVHRVRKKEKRKLKEVVTSLLELYTDEVA